MSWQINENIPEMMEIMNDAKYDGNEINLNAEHFHFEYNYLPARAKMCAFKLYEHFLH